MASGILITKFNGSKEEVEFLKNGESESFNTNLPSRNFDEKWLRLRIEGFCNLSHTIYFLIKHGEKVGYIIFSIKFSGYAWVESLFISNKFRGQGYAELLIKELKSDENISKIGLNVFIRNETALKLYKKLGFEVCSMKMEYQCEND